MPNWEDYFDREAGVMDWEGFYAAGGTDEMIPQNVRDSFGGEHGGAYPTQGGINAGGSTGGIDGGGTGSYEDFLKWTEGRLQPWYEETTPVRDTFRRWLDLGGVEAGREGQIARHAEGAALRAGEGAAGMGMQTLPAVLANRRENMGMAGGVLSGLSSQLAGLLRGQMGSGASAFGSIYGRNPYGGQWRSDTPGEQSEYGTGTTVGAPTPGSNWVPPEYEWGSS
jgi:hypothetical protein